MCFYHDVCAEFWKEDWLTARKPHRCCECRLPIRAGEFHQKYVGKWDGHWDTFRTCETCYWLRERVAGYERERGCRGSEAYPAFMGLYEALDDEHGEAIGLVDLLQYHETHG